MFEKASDFVNSFPRNTTSENYPTYWSTTAATFLGKCEQRFNRLNSNFDLRLVFETFP